MKTGVIKEEEIKSKGILHNGFYDASDLDYTNNLGRSGFQRKVGAVLIKMTRMQISVFWCPGLCQSIL